MNLNEAREWLEGAITEAAAPLGHPVNEYVEEIIGTKVCKFYTNPDGRKFGICVPFEECGS